MLVIKNYNGRTLAINNTVLNDFSLTDTQKTCVSFIHKTSPSSVEITDKMVLNCDVIQSFSVSNYDPFDFIVESDESDVKCEFVAKEVNYSGILKRMSMSRYVGNADLFFFEIKSFDLRQPEFSNYTKVSLTLGNVEEAIFLNIYFEKLELGIVVNLEIYNTRVTSLVAKHLYTFGYQDSTFKNIKAHTIGKIIGLRNSTKNLEVEKKVE
ncbi:hypothetical protein EIN_446050 [Entamoeba invadens IP1]|uniref:Uncharacterized protein n=1 Tax=Entamoeba invadens IP1 TaxID=370355 RepID=L7FMD6_ENTIV|nr:hypothetical protein EIN_446050 [Entamoeba invadens IP1]ELP86048.1 hypothetical protein EIN_446050 [Entamoeba invadens IP1]|eukprot:XP_004185394.1 hypothetical protein EIN_446050 [Entamoeba invadens IP1]